MHNLSQRLTFGLLLLLLADIIWIMSSKFINNVPYKTDDYKKPFFFAYTKASIFTLYFLVYIIFKELRKPCGNQTNYMFVNFDTIENGDDDEEDDNVFTDETERLSTASYVPIKNPSLTSGTESDDSGTVKPNNKVVRFNKVAEVRHLSETEATEALMARLSYAATLRAREICRLSRQLLNLHQTAKLAFTVAPLVIITLPDSHFSFSEINVGFALSLCSAIFYALNIVTLRSWVDHEDKLDIILYFGLVGLFNVLMFWPLFIFLHYFELETFEWPNKQQAISLFINGVVKATLPEVIWLWGCLLTSSIIATMSIGLTIPMSLMLSGISSQNKSDYERFLLPSFYLGLVPTTFSYFSLIWLTHRFNYNQNDYNCLSRCQRKNLIRLRDSDAEQAESLIQIHETDKEV
ncbi:solute carrier family 35 member F5 isoform X2 [Acyrthosiphon pisum]|uniref:Solute carrier family 35 member F5 n=1 Tax=Acyrthosiphon pisum TaxID=7029 RepID=A0A8R2D5J2_ACYPI|nr:solute carrier family 35 member F5 isoform X2 [Acyrthosiphon pisum]|eukprot:XP_016661678.1 PREDICTED: solute carrier family 35 member F5 isoform X3 [Acyrthosiphon pisum]